MPAEADTTVTGFFSQRVQASAEQDDNASNPLRSTADLGVTLVRRTPTTSLTLSPGVRLTASENVSFSDLTPRLNAAAGFNGPRLNLSSSVSFVPDFVTDSQFEDTGARDDQALQLTLSASVGAAYRVDTLNRLTVGFDARATEFVDTTADLTPTRSVGVTGGWSRTVDPRTSLTLSGGLRQLVADADTRGEKTDSVVLSLSGGFERSLTPRASMTASLGPSLVFSERTERTGGALRTTSEVSPGVNAALGFSYLSEHTTLAASFSQDVDQSSDGATVSRSRLSLSTSWALTERVTAATSVTAQTQTPFLSTSDSSDRSTIAFSPTLSYALSSAWTLRGGYVLRAADEDSSTTVENIGFLQVSRGLSLLP